MGGFLPGFLPFFFGFFLPGFLNPACNTDKIIILGLLIYKMKTTRRLPSVSMTGV